MINPISESELRKHGIAAKPLKIEVQYTYVRDTRVNPKMDYWTPPVGWVFDYIENKWVKTGVYRRGQRKDDCFWEVDERFKLFKTWKKEEEKKQKTNPDYKHPELQQFIRDCWRNRLSGYWFSNRGEPTYISGQHWFYLSVFRMDIGLPKYREVDRDVFYMWELAHESPTSYGLILLTKRRNGKSYQLGCLAVEQASRQQRFRAGIQSKTDDDAAKVYREHVFYPFKSMPYFFKPEKMELPKGGKAPASGLKFNSGNMEDDSDDEGEELQSVIDYRPSGILAYDGWKMKFYGADETGKTSLVSVYERWGTVKKCLVDDNDNVIGKSFQTTTVEDMEMGGREFLKMYRDSDQGNLKEGQTVSGLWKIFIPAYKTKDIDKYGRCDEEANKLYFLKKRERLQNNPRELSKEKRQNPFFEEEAFSTDSTQCVFDPIRLDDRIETLTWIPEQFERGNFHWKDGKRFSEVIWVKNTNGKFCVKEHPPEGKRNLVTKRGEKYFAGNTEMYCGGIDTYDHKHLSKDSERTMSMGSITILKKDDPIHKTEINGGPACFYLFRPESPEIFWEDTLMCLWYYGCLGLVETNKPGLLNYLETHNCECFVPILPGKSTRGLATGSATNNYIGELTDQFISDEWEEDGITKKRIDTVFFLPLLLQWKEFSPADTTAYDGAMSFGLAKMLEKNAISKTVKKESSQDISEYFSFMRSKSYNATH